MLMFRTQYNFDEIPMYVEHPDETLVTEPGLAMDVPTMIRRYAQGTLSGLSVRNPVFDDLDEPDPTETPGFDLTDADAYLRAISDKVSVHRASAAKKKTDPADAASPSDANIPVTSASENEP